MIPLFRIFLLKKNLWCQFTSIIPNDNVYIICIFFVFHPSMIVSFFIAVLPAFTKCITSFCLGSKGNVITNLLLLDTLGMCPGTKYRDLLYPESQWLYPTTRYTIPLCLLCVGSLHACLLKARHHSNFLCSPSTFPPLKFSTKQVIIHSAWSFDKYNKQGPHIFSNSSGPTIAYINSNCLPTFYLPSLFLFLYQTQNFRNFIFINHLHRSSISKHKRLSFRWRPLKRKTRHVNLSYSDYSERISKHKRLSFRWRPLKRKTRQVNLSYSDYSEGISKHKRPGFSWCTLNRKSH